MLLSEVPIFDLIFAAEERHGVDTHMVVEVVYKNSEKALQDDDPPIDDIVWWVEFENECKILNTFEEVEKYFLEECHPNPKSRPILNRRKVNVGVS